MTEDEENVTPPNCEKLLYYYMSLQDATSCTADPDNIFEQWERTVCKEHLGTEDCVGIYDCAPLDDPDEVEDEIYGECEQFGFPKREKQMHDMPKDMNGTHPFWIIHVPEIGKGVLFQNASPLIIYFRKSDVLTSSLKFRANGE